MKVVVRKKHIAPMIVIVAVFATIQNLTELRRPPIAVAIGIGIGIAAGAVTWLLALASERKGLRRTG